MDGGWRRTVGNVRSFFGNLTGGLRGGSNLASWVVAGTLAYYLWVKPSQELKREQEVYINTSDSLNLQPFCSQIQVFLVLSSILTFVLAIIIFFFRKGLRWRLLPIVIVTLRNGNQFQILR